MEMEREFILNDCTVTVIYDYYPEEKETRDDPPMGAEIEIDKIMFEGVNVHDIVCPDDYDYLRDKIYEYHKDESNFMII